VRNLLSLFLMETRCSGKYLLMKSCSRRTFLRFSRRRLWDKPRCSPLSVNRLFGGTYRLYRQGGIISEVETSVKAVAGQLVSLLLWGAGARCALTGGYNRLTDYRVLMEQLPWTKSIWNTERRREEKERIVRMIGGCNEFHLNFRVVLSDVILSRTEG
jgi:hypothetical protein